MLFALLKALISGAVIAAASEVAKRNPSLGALIVALPLVSILTMLWLWRDTGDVVRIAGHARATFCWSCPRCRCFWFCPGCWGGASGSGRRWPCPAC